MPARRRKAKGEEKISAFAKAKPKIRLHRDLKDKRGNSIKIVRTMIDAPVYWLGPWSGNTRGLWVSFDESVGTKHLLMGLGVLPPGNEIALHAHEVEEGYMIVKGRGVMYTDKGEECEVQPYDGIWNGPNVRHCLKNIGDEDLWVVWAWGWERVGDFADHIAAYRGPGVTERDWR